MKDGRTHLAHKVEHAVDLETDAVVGVTVQPADRGDTQSVEETIDETLETLAAVLADEEAAAALGDSLMEEAVLDRGYHSAAVLEKAAERGIRAYIAEPKRGRRVWKGKAEQQALTYANRRRIRGERGKQLAKLRAEKVERSNAHCYETGGMRRVHLRGHGKRPQASACTRRCVRSRTGDARTRRCWYAARAPRAEEARMDDVICAPRRCTAALDGPDVAD